MRTRTTGVALAILLAAAGVAHAVPHTVSFTARITDTSGNPATGPLTLTVALFDAGSGGTMVWEETHTGVPAVNGLVYTSLGDVDPVNNALTDTVFSGAALYAELTVDGDVLSPRIPIASVPYAVRADVADTLTGFDPTSVQKRVTGSCATGHYITAVAADGTVSCGVDGGGSGTITGVTASTGLSGGGTTGAVSLSVDTTVIQARVSGSCATGTYITAVAANGTVSCGTDQVGTGTITGVTASTGLSGGGTSGTVSLSVNTAVIQARVTGTCATGNFITAVAADGTVTCVAGDTGTISGVTAGTGLSGGGTTGAVTVNVATAGITTALIADGAVTMAKTTAPIGSASNLLTPGQINGQSLVLPVAGSQFTADSNGTCFVTAWAQSDASSNAVFYLEPAMQNTATSATVLPGALAWTPVTYPSIGGPYEATSSATVSVTSGIAYNVGCLLGTVGFTVKAPLCHVSWICN